MTEPTKHPGRPTGYVLSQESRATISAGVTRAWADPEKRQRLVANRSSASKQGWETRRRRKATEAAEAAEAAAGQLNPASTILETGAG